MGRERNAIIVTTLAPAELGWAKLWLGWVGLGGEILLILILLHDMWVYRSPLPLSLKVPV